MRVIVRLLLALVLTAAALVAASVPAAADHAFGHPPCLYDGVPRPCQAGDGLWSNADSCYMHGPPQPEPPASYEGWAGQWPRGHVYWAWCPESLPWPPKYDAYPPWGSMPGEGDDNWGPLWSGPRGPTPEELAAMAIADLLAQMEPPAVDSAPPPGAFGFVGLTMWLWADPSPTTWGPLTATASGGGITVTATAQVEDITYTLGDGQSIVCDEGTPYTGGDHASPDCGYVYATTSADQPGEEYTITGTARWVITWSGGGESGSEEHERSASVPARVGEVQTIIE